MALSDLLQPRLAQLGQIKIGGLGESRRTRSGGTFRLPVKYGHIVITHSIRNEQGDLIVNEDLMRELIEQHGDSDGKLRQLPISLLSDEIEDSLQSAYVCYAGKRLAARSDGQTVEWFADPQTKRWLDEPRVEEWRPEMAEMTGKDGAKLFKLHTKFSCTIRSVEAAFGGLYTFRTTSSITANQLYGALIKIKSRELTCGVLSGLPLWMVLRPLQVTPGGKPTTIYVFHCEIRASDFLAVQDMASRILANKVQYAAQIEANRAQYQRLLTAPGYETDPEEVEGVVAEFHPEAAIDEAPAENAAEVLDDLLGPQTQSADVAHAPQTPAETRGEQGTQDTAESAVAADGEPEPPQRPGPDDPITAEEIDDLF